MNTIDEAIEVLQAMKEGKTIQMQSGGVWVDRAAGFVDVVPRFDITSYRVKPEPVFDWAVESFPKNAPQAAWQESGTVYRKTESEMKKVIDQWTTQGSKHYPYNYRARKLTPAEEALT